MVNNEREYFEMEKEKEKKGQCLSIKFVVVKVGEAFWITNEVA